MLSRTPPPSSERLGWLGMGRMVVPIYCICQPHYHALASWHTEGAGKEMEHVYATSSSTDR